MSKVFDHVVNVDEVEEVDGTGANTGAASIADSPPRCARAGAVSE
jgi:hypothetical protein